MTSYFNGAIPLFPDSLPIESAISQLQLTSAVAPFIQIEDHAVVFASSDPPGPGGDHNLLAMTPVIIDQNLGNMSAVNSIKFNSVAADPNAGSLWLNQSNNHLMHGAIDLESGGGGGNVTSTSSPVTGDALVRFDGTSGTFVETSQVISGSVNTQFYSGPQISALGYNCPNPAASTTSIYLEHYSTSFINASYTGPYITPAGTVLILLERIGNIVNLTLASDLSQVADGTDANIVMTTPVPIGFRPTSVTKVGILPVISDGVYRTGTWEMSSAGILTIKPTIDPAIQFLAPVAGVSGIIPFFTFSYTIRN